MRDILNEVATFAEATRYLGKSKQYLNDLVKSGKLIEGKDYRSAGRIKLIKYTTVSFKCGENRLKLVTGTELINKISNLIREDKAKDISTMVIKGIFITNTFQGITLDNILTDPNCKGYDPVYIYGMPKGIDSNKLEDIAKNKLPGIATFQCPIYREEIYKLIIEKTTITLL